MAGIWTFKESGPGGHVLGLAVLTGAAITDQKRIDFS